MAELLVLAQTGTAQDGPGKWYEARIVTVQEDGHIWGGKEAPPKFYILKVPGISREDAVEYLAEWRHNPSYSVVNSQPAQDSYRIKLASDAVAISGKGAITLGQVEAFFTRWNSTIKSSTSDSITFDIRIYDAAISDGFWGRDTSGLLFEETTYNQATGSHLIGVISSQVTDAQIEEHCAQQGVAYVEPRSFIVTRTEIKQKLQDEIAERFREIMIDRRRWYISQAGMDALQAAGGIMTVTPAQFVSNLRDGFAD